MRKKSPCEGCIYWNPVNLRDKSGLYFCSYCYGTGHSRPCEAGKGCIVRKEKHAETLPYGRELITGGNE